MATVTIGETRAIEAARARRQAGVRKAFFSALTYVLGVLVFLFVFFPILWLIDTSFKTSTDAWAVPVQYIPLHPTLDNYGALIAGTASGDLSLWPHYFANSLFTAG